MPKRLGLHAAILTAATMLAPGCSDHEDGLLNPPDESPPYDPVIPTQWASAVTNPLFPLTLGTILEYRGETDEGTETIIVEVLSDTKVIQGVTATVVSDRVYLEGVLFEDTVDWFAQDAAGNVWYLGEETTEFLEGGEISTAGSWEWGVDGALPGIVMWADPSAHIGQKYRQEFYKGEAEDWAKVLGVDEDVSVPYGDFEGCLETLEWNGLEPGAKENKFYAPGIGLVLEIPKEEEDRVELISVTTR